MDEYSGSIRTRAAVLCAAVAVVFVSLGALSSAVAEDQDAARPTLSDFMVLTQLRHYKLWYSERLENWKLADYELNQLVTTVDRIAKLYPEARSVAQANLIREKTDPALLGLRAEIRDKNNSRFELAFNQVTDVGKTIAGPLVDGAVAAHQGNFAAAHQIFEPLALQGNAAAQFNLGYLYSSGFGVRRDEAEALKWYRKAAEQGLAIAQYHLGLAFQFGDGLDPDPVEAVKWFRRSADQDFHDAQLALGIAHATGQGVDANLVKAYMWMTLAVQARVRDAAWVRYSFSKWMNADQIREAQELIREWKPAPESGRTAFPEVGELIETHQLGEPGDPKTWPVQAVGRLTIHSGGLVGFCSGVLVGPKLVLTAAHCLVNRAQLLSPNSVEFGAGMSRAVPEYSSVAERFFLSDEVSPRTGYHGISPLIGDAVSDWALIQLKQAIPIKPISIRVLSSDEMKAASKDGTILQIGYGAERPYLPSVARNCRLYPTEFGNRVFLSRCLANPGYSGSPILVETGGITSVVGIMSAAVSHLFGIACSASQFEKRIAELTAELGQ